MKNLVVAFGGESCEHDISCITAVQAMMAVDRKKYRVIPLYVDKSGRCFSSSKLATISGIKGFSKKDKLRCYFSIGSNEIVVGRKAVLVDFALLCFHGGIYEGGGFAGLMELCKIPCSSSGILGNALGMNKAMQKKFASSLGVDTLPFRLCRKSENVDLTFDFQGDKSYVIKPNDMGSSIGISTATNQDEIFDGLGLVFTYTNEAIVEKQLKDFYELNVAVFNDFSEITLSQIEKPLKENEILTFEDKYLSKAGKSKGMTSLIRQIPAEISKEIKVKVQEVALKLYGEMGLSGIVRFDFMVEGDVVYFNEVNTIPGSLGFYLFEDKYSFRELLGHMIESEIQEFDKKNKIIRSINTLVL